MPSMPNDLTVMINKALAGDPEAMQVVMELVEGELTKLARSYMRREAGDHILQPTALVNEAYVNLFHGRKALSVESRKHFFCTASKQMRHILVDYARSENTGKRRGIKIEFDEIFHGSNDRNRDMIALDDALSALSEVHPDLAQLVELKFFAGHTYEDVAELLDSNVSAVRRDWELARAYLLEYLSKA